MGSDDTNRDVHSVSVNNVFNIGKDSKKMMDITFFLTRDDVIA